MKIWECRKRGEEVKLLARIEETFVGLLLVAVTLVLFSNVILRYVFDQSLVWAEEFIRYGIIWITFIGLAICFRKNIHFGVDVILRMRNKFAVKIVKCAVIILSGLFSGIVFKYGLELTLFTKDTGQIAPASEIPLYLIYMAIPIGAGLSLIYIIKNLISTIKNEEIKNEEIE